LVCLLSLGVHLLQLLGPHRLVRLPLLRLLGPDLLVLQRLLPLVSELFGLKLLPRLCLLPFELHLPLASDLLVLQRLLPWTVGPFGLYPLPLALELFELPSLDLLLLRKLALAPGLLLLDGLRALLGVELVPLLLPLGLELLQ